MKNLANDFKAFPKQYSLAPLWFWNDDLTEEEIIWQLKELKSKNIMEFMSMPMAGLNTPYLSPEYFDMFLFTVKQAEKLGMKHWIYDEYCWPGGCAGGIIQEKFPHYKMTACRFYKYPVSEKASRSISLALPEGQLIVAEAVKAGGRKIVDLMEYTDGFSLNVTLPPGDWEITLAVIVKVGGVLDACTLARWSNNAEGYIDVMNPEAMGKFVELVYDAHYEVAGKYFGNTIPGFFSDEPGAWFDLKIKGSDGVFERYAWGKDVHSKLLDSKDPNLYGFYCSVPWTFNMLELFHQRYGYQLLPNLTALVRRGEKDRKVCYDYMKLVSDRFAESYFGLLGKWCEEHNVIATGHIGEHPNQGDFYSQVGPMQIPGIDNLGGTNKLKGPELLLPKMVSSLAHMNGNSRSMCEVYGVTPWNFTIADKIENADMLAVQGVNMITPIDYAYSFRSIRKHTTNPPGFYQSANWKHQKEFSNHVARVCMMTSAGKAAVNTAIMFSTSENLASIIHDYELAEKQEENIKAAYLSLINVQIESDIIFEEGLDKAKISAGSMLFPGAEYKHIVLPQIRILKPDTIELLAKFANAGGKIFCLNEIPGMSPEGENIFPLLKKYFGISSELKDAKPAKTFSCGKGSFTFIPDDTWEVSISDNITSGHFMDIFDDSNSVLVISDQYPITVQLDLCKTRQLDSLTITVEDIKTEVLYDYQVLVSDDNCSWHNVIDEKQVKGKVQNLDLKGAKGRYLRWQISEGGGRFLALEKLNLKYLDSKGNLKTWKPEKYQPRKMANFIDDNPSSIKFYENTELAESLFTNTRQLDNNEQILTVINTKNIERMLTGKLDNYSSVEIWDQDSAEIKKVFLDRNTNSFNISFFPGQTRIFVLKEQSIITAPALTDFTRKTVKVLSDRWDFKTERENAFPLTAGKVKMADPRYPDKWYDSIAGKIPEILHFVPEIMFKVEFSADYINGDEVLLYEDMISCGFNINGNMLPGIPEKYRYYDMNNMALKVGNILKKGKNIISGIFKPEIYERTGKASWYSYPNIQPTLDIFILGHFSVNKNNVIEKSENNLKYGPWYNQGYPYYTGTGIYSSILEWAKDSKNIWLEIDTALSVAGVSVNGKDVGIRLAEPWLFDLSGNLEEGENFIEISLTNTVGQLFSAQKIGYQWGVPEFNAGLLTAKLVEVL